jgi:hypothetical protein
MLDVPDGRRNKMNYWVEQLFQLQEPELQPKLPKQVNLP